MLYPPTLIVPEVGFIIPESIFVSVDFPAPFGPNKPKSSPLATFIETLSTAAVS